MKARDYFIVAILCVVLVWAFTPSDHSLAQDRPVLAAVMKIAKLAGWALLIYDEPPDAVVPQSDPYRFEELPRELVNTYPPRQLDSSGEPQLDYSTGW